MVTPESLIEEYEKLANEDLFLILAKRDDYTETAKNVAREELVKRGVPNDKINKLLSGITYGYSKKERDKFLIDLKLWQKIVLYFILIPQFRTLFNNNFYEKGYVLKVRQSNYYLVISISLMIVSLILYANWKINALIVWALCFIPALLFDIGYNRERQIRNIQEQIEKSNSIDF